MRHALPLILALLLLPTGAHTSQVHFDEVSLDALLARSPLVVVARPTTRRIESVPLGEGIAPYGYAVQRYDVVEVLRPARAAKPGEAVEVSSFDSLSLGLHIAYEAQGMSVSPIVPHYSAVNRPKEGEPVILFLQRSAFLTFDPKTGGLVGADDTWARTVDGAVEGMASKAAVAEKAAAPCDCDQLNLTVGAIGFDEALRGRVDAAIDARFGAQGSMSWSVVELRPKKEG